MSNTVRLYHFINDKWGLENIAKRRLKVAFADQVNDLFEFRPFDFGKGEKGRDRRYAWGEAIKAHSMLQGFISFSKTWAVPTMWAHYADNHKGICLGFDVRACREDGEPYSVKMKYRKQLTSMDDRVLKDRVYNRKVLEIAKTTKSEHWMYEDEWRCWASLSDEERKQKRADPDRMFFNPFDEKLVLKEVIFGAKSRLSTCRVQKILSPLDDVEFSTARPSFRAFKMVRQRLEEYQK